jgi:hypothetical protein
MSKPNGSQVSNYFAEMRRMSELLTDFYTPIEAQQWLVSKQRLLGDETPAHLIAHGRVAEVERLIEQMRDGVFL